MLVFSTLLRSGPRLYHSFFTYPGCYVAACPPLGALPLRAWRDARSPNVFGTRVYARTSGYENFYARG